MAVKGIGPPTGLATGSSAAPLPPEPPGPPGPDWPVEPEEAKVLLLLRCCSVLSPPTSGRSRGAPHGGGDLGGTRRRAPAGERDRPPCRRGGDRDPLPDRAAGRDPLHDLAGDRDLPPGGTTGGLARLAGGGIDTARPGRRRRGGEREGRGREGGSKSLMINMYARTALALRKTSAN